MLRKLMKYDLKYYLRIMFPLWVVLIIYGIIHGINTMNSEIYNQISVKEEAVIVVISIYFIFCMNIILVIQRFWKSMYGTESYPSRNTDSTFSGFHKTKSCFNDHLYDPVWNHMDDASDLSGIYSNMHWTDEK